jgi:hypothetical protein
MYTLGGFASRQDDVHKQCQPFKLWEFDRAEELWQKQL